MFRYSSAPTQSPLVLAPLSYSFVYARTVREADAANMRESHAVRWRAAWEGNRGLGQRSIEIAIPRDGDSERRPKLPSARSFLK